MNDERGIAKAENGNWKIEIGKWTVETENPKSET